MSHPEFNFFSAYFPSTTDMLNSFDWSISDVIDINSISFSKRNKPFLRFLKTFRDAKSFSGGRPEQIIHLLQVLQQSIRYFSSDHERMREALNVREAEINSLYQQIRNLKSNGGNLQGSDIYFCPICLNGFDSYHTVDMHIEIQHPTLAEKWREIRHPSMQQPKKKITSSSSSEIQPGSKKITQDDVLNAVGESMHQKLQENAKSYQDLRNEMSTRFQEFTDLLNANSYSSYYSNNYIGGLPSNKSGQAQVKKKKRKHHSKISSGGSSVASQSNTNDFSYSTTAGTYSYSTINQEEEMSNSSDFSYSKSNS